MKVVIYFLFSLLAIHAKSQCDKELESIEYNVKIFSNYIDSGKKILYEKVQVYSKLMNDSCLLTESILLNNKLCFTVQYFKENISKIAFYNLMESCQSPVNILFKDSILEIPTCYKEFSLTFKLVKNISAIKKPDELLEINHIINQNNLFKNGYLICISKLEFY